MRGVRELTEGYDYCTSFSCPNSFSYEQLFLSLLCAVLADCLDVAGGVLRGDHLFFFCSWNSVVQLMLSEDILLSPPTKSRVSVLSESLPWTIGSTL
jgi:hypothetical protein